MNRILLGMAMVLLLASFSMAGQYKVYTNSTGSKRVEGNANATVQWFNVDPRYAETQVVFEKETTGSVTVKAKFDGLGSSSLEQTVDLNGTGSSAPSVKFYSPSILQIGLDSSDAFNATIIQEMD